MVQRDASLLGPLISDRSPSCISDCDIYGSAVDILRLAGQIGPGTVILFDEYLNYPSWENREYKAWKQFAESNGVSYTYLGFARQQVPLPVDAVRTR